MGSCVARQPVFTRTLNIYGYDLLFQEEQDDKLDNLDNAGRDNPPDTPGVDGVDSDAVSSQTIIHGFYDIGIARVTNNKRGFVAFTEKLLRDMVATILPAQILVIELPRDIAPTPEIIDTCRALRQQGYPIALADFRLEGELMPMLEVADIVRIELVSSGQERVREFIKQRMKTHPQQQFLAARLETPADFELAKKYGFTLFQGNFFSRPSVVKSGPSVPSPGRRQLLQLIRLSLDPEIDYWAISNIIKQDITLSYRLLRVVNSTFFGLRYTVSNIRQALSILGVKEVKKWITLISLSGLTENKPNELIIMSLIRARFMELIAPETGLEAQADDLFLLGLMSMMDAVMDMSMTAIVTQTNVAAHIATPLLTHEGELGQLLELIICYERSDWERARTIAAQHALSLEHVFDIYMQSIEWAQQL